MMNEQEMTDLSGFQYELDRMETPHAYAKAQHAAGQGLMTPQTLIFSRPTSPAPETPISKPGNDR